MSRLGRPPLRPEERKTKGVRVRFTDAELRQVKARAKAAGVTVAEFLRKLALRA